MSKCEIEEFEKSFYKKPFYNQHKKIVDISVKRLQSAVSRRSIFFASHSANLSMFMEYL